MPKFFYKSKLNGKIKEGFVEAKNMQKASEKIEAWGMVLLELKEQGQSDFDVRLNYEIKPLTIKEKKDFYASFYNQYKAGISFFEIFNNIIKTASTNNIKTLCYSILRKIQKDNSVENAFSCYSKYIGETYAMLIIAGDKTGKLVNILQKISQQVEMEEEIDATIKSKIKYPKILFVLIVFSICAYIFFIFPVFNNITDRENYNLLCIGVKALLKTSIIVPVTSFLFFGLVKNICKQKKFTNFILNSKIAGGVLKNYYFFNFFTILYLAQEAGISLDEALALSSKTIKLYGANQKILKAQKMISQGCEIATAFGVAGVFSDFALSQISTAEKSGELSKAYEAIASDYKQNCITKIDTILKSIEPAMLFVVSICVVVLGVKMYTKYYQTLLNLF